MKTKILSPPLGHYVAEEGSKYGKVAKIFASRYSSRYIIRKVHSIFSSVSA
jgi:hypothetical protein